MISNRQQGKGELDHTGSEDFQRMTAIRERFVRFYLLSCALLISIFIYLFLSGIFRHIFIVLLLVGVIFLWAVPDARIAVIKTGEEIMSVIFDR